MVFGIKMPSFSSMAHKAQAASSWGRKALGTARDVALRGVTQVAETSSALEKGMDSVDKATRDSGADDLLALTPFGAPVAAARATVRAGVRGTRALSTVAKKALESDNLTDALRGGIAVRKQVNELREQRVPTAPAPPPMPRRR